jgi:transcriptional regulator with XRE-family HTH domain
MERGLEIGRLTYRQARLAIANRIKEARLDAGLTQDDIARELSISQSSYSRIESGRLAPDCAQIRVLSGIYGLSILWLLGMPSYFVYAQSSSSSSP